MHITHLGPARAWQQEWAEVARRLASSPSPAVRRALRQGFVLTHEQARRAGCSDADIRRLVYRGTWSVPHRGVLAVLPPGTESSPGGRRIEVCAAAARLVRPRTAISLASAAAAYGLPIFGRARRPELTSASIPRTADRGGARVYAADLRPDELRGWYGAPITTPARTVVDLARHGRRSGLIAADAALHEGLVSTEQLDRALRRATGWPGIRKARAVLALASDKVESPLESLSRLLCADHDIAVPEPQAWICTGGGWFRVDGLWAERLVVLEADGMLKYAERSGALPAEKKRQEWLERAGYRVVRVTWDDVVGTPSETVARIRRALALGGPGPDSACCSA